MKDRTISSDKRASKAIRNIDMIYERPKTHAGISSEDYDPSDILSHQQQHRFHPHHQQRFHGGRYVGSFKPASGEMFAGNHLSKTSYRPASREVKKISSSSISSRKSYGSLNEGDRNGSTTGYRDRERIRGRSTTTRRPETSAGHSSSTFRDVHSSVAFYSKPVSNRSSSSDKMRKEDRNGNNSIWHGRDIQNEDMSLSYLASGTRMKLTRQQSRQGIRNESSSLQNATHTPTERSKKSSSLAFKNNDEINTHQNQNETHSHHPRGFVESSSVASTISPRYDQNTMIVQGRHASNRSVETFDDMRMDFHNLYVEKDVDNRKKQERTEFVQDKSVDRPLSSKRGINRQPNSMKARPFSSGALHRSHRGKTNVSASIETRNAFDIKIITSSSTSGDGAGGSLSPPRKSMSNEELGDLSSITLGEYMTNYLKVSPRGTNGNNKSGSDLTQGRTIGWGESNASSNPSITTTDALDDTYKYLEKSNGLEDTDCTPPVDVNDDDDSRELHNRIRNDIGYDLMDDYTDDDLEGKAEYRGDRGSSNPPRRFYRPRLYYSGRTTIGGRKHDDEEKDGRLIEGEGDNEDDDDDDDDDEEIILFRNPNDTFVPPSRAESDDLETVSPVEVDVSGTSPSSSSSFRESYRPASGNTLDLRPATAADTLSGDHPSHTHDDLSTSSMLGSHQDLHTSRAVPSMTREVDLSALSADLFSPKEFVTSPTKRVQQHYISKSINREIRSNGTAPAVPSKSNGLWHECDRPPSRQLPPAEALHLFSDVLQSSRPSTAVVGSRPFSRRSRQRPRSGPSGPSEEEMYYNHRNRPPSRQRPPPETLDL